MAVDKDRKNCAQVVRVICGVRFLHARLFVDSSTEASRPRGASVYCPPLVQYGAILYRLGVASAPLSEKVEVGLKAANLAWLALSNAGEFSPEPESTAYGLG